ncbi:InlB B-repeat-containing protein [Butyrivibrio sp. WCD3002]|uniref:InlB B-repeat-containing protein n=1 Tax=Butyrivibrio sp. WCD3002 TaxID=1280676 RepID=UPI00041A0791|nr:InlB B-repeat-containing protein [Butyrivibrio sp. WCD3002]
MKEILGNKVKGIARALSLALAFSMIIPDASPVMAATYNEAAEDNNEAARGIATEDEYSEYLPTGDADTVDVEIADAIRISPEAFDELEESEPQLVTRNGSFSTDDFYYKQLNTVEKAYYDAYLKLSKANKGATEYLDENNAAIYGVKVYEGYDDDFYHHVQTVHSALAYDHPEELESVVYKYNVQPFVTEVNNRDKYVYYAFFTPKQTYTGAQLAQMENQLQNAFESFYSNLNLSGDDFNKELIIHDALMKTMTYNDEAADRNIKGHVAHTAYGAFVDNMPVCDGYAKAFKMLLNKAGIECHVVGGYGNGDLHAWNVVKLGNDYYDVDVTWDDREEDPENKYFMLLSHEFFNRTTAEFEDHNFNDIPNWHGTSTHFRDEEIMGYLTAPEGKGKAKSFRNVKKVFPVTFDGVEDDVYIYLPYGDTCTYEGKIIEIPTDVRLDNYEFDGWYTEKTGGKLVTEDTAFDTAPTVYARWKGAQITVGLVNGYDHNAQMITVRYHEKYGELAVPTRPGYIFDGWFTDYSYKTEITADTVVERINGHRLYAKWVPIEVTVKLDNCYDEQYQEIKVLFDEYYDNLPDLERTGFTFDGWYFNKDYNEKVKSNSIVTDYNDHWLYAKWIPEENESTGENQGETTEGETTEGETTEGETPQENEENHTVKKATVYFHSDNSSVAFQRVEIEQGKTISDAIDRIIMPSRETHTFKGWYTGYYTEEKVSENIVIGDVEELNLYAQWTPKPQTLTLFANGGSFSDDSFVKVLKELYDTRTDLSSIEKPVRDGYTFKGWSEYPDKIYYCYTAYFYRDQYLYAVWEKNEQPTEETENIGKEQESEGTENAGKEQESEETENAGKEQKSEEKENVNNEQSSKENDTPAQNIPAKNAPAKDDAVQNNPSENTSEEVAFPEDGKIEVEGKEYQLSASGTAAVHASTNKNAKTVSTGEVVTYGSESYKVVEIEKNAYKNCKKLTSANIGSNIEKIGANAFAGCKNLKKITIVGNNLKVVGKGSFKGIKKAAKITIICKDKKTFDSLVKKLKKAGAGKAKFKFKKG